MLLSDPDSRFISINGLQVHYKIAGSGLPVYLLLHGFAASVFSWREVMDPLARQGTVIAFDRPAYGFTERPMKWKGPNPYTSEFSASLAVGLLDALSIDQAVLVGNSAGGAVALLAALHFPRRVRALILVDPAIYIHSVFPDWALPFLRLPLARPFGVRLARKIKDWGLKLAAMAWHDPARLTPEIMAGYTRPMQAQDWDVALWYATLAPLPAFQERLKELHLPALVITGEDDRVVPAEQSIRLAGELPQSQLVVLPECGHVPQEECPQAFLEAVLKFSDELVKGRNHVNTR